MLRHFYKKTGKRGFTLVELLITVAIIGILSTIGVPTFRKMIQKSKKSEAKVNLGGIYTTETAFYAEYNGYGNNLGIMGFDSDGLPSTATYLLGFYVATCGGVNAINPSSTMNPVLYSAINAAFPAYYGTLTNSTTAGFNATTQNCYGLGLTLPNMTAANGNTVTPTAFDADPGGGYFIAGATGVLAPGIDRNKPATNQVDIWFINNNRLLSNIQDGVQ